MQIKSQKWWTVQISSRFISGESAGWRSHGLKWMLPWTAQLTLLSWWTTYEPGFRSLYPPVIKYGLPENGQFIIEFPIKTSISRGFPIAMFDYWRVNPIKSHKTTTFPMVFLRFSYVFPYGLQRVASWDPPSGWLVKYDPSKCQPMWIRMSRWCDETQLTMYHESRRAQADQLEVSTIYSIFSIHT